MTDKHDSTDFVMPEAELLRGSDDLLADFDRGVTVFNEFVTGCRNLYDIGTAVTVFGSARFDENHRYYQLARQLGRELAGDGYTVLTGGGPGIMEAANRGAQEGGGLSVGCNITLPHEQTPNALMTAVEQFEKHESYFDPTHIRTAAERFAPARFLRELQQQIELAQQTTAETRC